MRGVGVGGCAQASVVRWVCGRQRLQLQIFDPLTLQRGDKIF